MGTQRQNYRKNKLSDERKKRLDGLGFIWDALAEKWEEGFRELSAYHEKYCDSCVPQSYVTRTEFKLGIWVDKQTDVFNKNKLSDERKKRLDDLSFVWDPLTEQWEEGFKELSAYHQEHGNFSVPKSYETGTGFRLGGWVNAQRTNFQKNKLSDQRKKRLNDIGFVWDMLTEQWEEGFKELSTFHQEHGDCVVHQSHISASGFKLGAWVARQRQNAKNNKLSEEKKQRLEKLRFVW